MDIQSKWQGKIKQVIKVVSKSKDGKSMEVIIHSIFPTGKKISETRHLAYNGGVAGKETPHFSGSKSISLNSKKNF